MIEHIFSHPPVDRCSCCGKALEVERNDDNDQRMIHGGGRLELSFGYGSSNDLRNVVMYICDECVVPFIDSRKCPVGEYCCLWFEEEKKLSPNVVIDQAYSDRHNEALEKAGVRWVPTEELHEYLADEPVADKLPPCTPRPPGDGS